MKSKRRKRKIVPYRRRFHLNIGIIIFAFVFIYFVIYLISYLTQNNIAVYEVQYGQIAKNKSYTGLVLRPEQVFYASDAGIRYRPVNCRSRMIACRIRQFPSTTSTRL